MILLVVLMFFGSKSIPGIAKTLGKAMRQIKDASQDLQNEIKKSGVDIQKDLNLNRMLEDTINDVERPFQEQEREIHAAISFEAPKNFEPPVQINKEGILSQTDAVEEAIVIEEKEIPSENSIPETKTGH